MSRDLAGEEIQKVRPGVEFSTRWGYPKKDKTTLRPANWPSMPFEPRTEKVLLH